MLNTVYIRLLFAITLCVEKMLNLWSKTEPQRVRTFRSQKKCTCGCVYVCVSALADVHRTGHKLLMNKLLASKVGSPTPHKGSLYTSLFMSSSFTNSVLQNCRGHSCVTCLLSAQIK